MGPAFDRLTNHNTWYRVTKYLRKSDRTARVLAVTGGIGKRFRMAERIRCVTIADFEKLPET